MQGKNFSSYKGLYTKAALENLNTMKKNLPLLAQRLQDQRLIDDIHRAAHNLKTESLLMGYSATGTLCKTIEDIFYKVKTEAVRLSEAELDLLLQGAAQIEQSLGLILREDKETDLSEITLNLKKIVGTTT